MKGRKLRDPNVGLTTGNEEKHFNNCVMGRKSICEGPQQSVNITTEGWKPGRDK